MDILKRSGELVSAWWSGLTPGSKVAFSAVAAIAVALVVFGSAVTSESGMTRIAGLEDLEQVRKRLEEKGRCYEVRPDGIYVPKGEAEGIVVNLLGEGLDTGDDAFKFLGETSFFSNEWERKKQYQVALQKRLEGLIRKLDPVRNAGVQLTPGAKAHRFGERGNDASASVVVELEPGAVLARQNVAAIAGLVAGSVQGLEADHVHIMDTQGMAYRQARRGADAMFPTDLHELETQIAERVKQVIEEAFPFEVRVIPGVQVRHSTTSRKEERVVDPQVIEEERSRKTAERVAVSQAGPIKGATDLLPMRGPAPVEQVLEEEEERVTYEHGTSNVETHEPAGEVKRVTLGILIPVPADASEDEVGRLEGMKSQIRKVARAAAPQAEEEDIEVLVVRTRAPAPLPPHAVEEADSLAAITSEPWFPYAGIGGGAVALLLVLWLLIRLAAPQKVVEEMAALRRLVEETPAAAGSGMDEDNLRLRLGVQDLVARSPRGAGAILKRWLKGGR